MDGIGFYPISISPGNEFEFQQRYLPFEF